MIVSCLSIRGETPDDVAEISSVIEQAFQRPDESRLVERLRGSDAFYPALSLVACDSAGLILGHVLFTRVDVEGTMPGTMLSLAPLAVLPASQRQGIGMALIREGLRLACTGGFGAVFVLGREKFYARAGFQPASEWKLECPFPIHGGAYMAVELRPGALAQATGRVTYSSAFSA